MQVVDRLVALGDPEVVEGRREVGDRVEERPGSVPLAPVREPAGKASPKLVKLPSTKYSLSFGKLPNRAGRIVETWSKVIRAIASGAAASTSLTCASKLVSPTLKEVSTTTVPPEASNVSLDELRQAGAVGVVDGDDAESRVTVLGDQVAEHLALEHIRRGGTEVQTAVVVVGERSRGVGRRELDDTGSGHLVDELQRSAGRRGTDDGRRVLAEDPRHLGLVRLVVGVTRVAVEELDGDARIGLVYLRCGVLGAGDLGRAEEEGFRSGEGWCRS